MNNQPKRQEPKGAQRQYFSLENHPFFAARGEDDKIPEIPVVVPTEKINKKVKKWEKLDLTAGSTKGGNPGGIKDTDWAMDSTKAPKNDIKKFAPVGPSSEPYQPPTRLKTKERLSEIRDIVKVHELDEKSPADSKVPAPETEVFKDGQPVVEPVAKIPEVTNPEVVIAPPVAEEAAAGVPPEVIQAEDEVAKVVGTAVPTAVEEEKAVATEIQEPPTDTTKLPDAITTRDKLIAGEGDAPAQQAAKLEEVWNSPEE